MLGFAPVGSQPVGSTDTTATAASTVTMVSVTPGTATGSQQFTATVVGTNSPSQSVTWATNAGSINSTGYFTAPAQTASVQTITITATSVQDGTKSGTATATIAAIGTPADTTAPTFTGALVQTAVTSTSCTIDWSSTVHTDNVGITGYEYNINGGIYYAIGNVLAYTFAGFTASTSYTIAVRAFDAAGNRSAALTATATTSATGSTVSGVTISPTTATGSQQFTATVLGTGGPSQVVNYTTTAGSISGLGYLTISQSSVIQTVTVTATSAQNIVFNATAVVTVPASTIVILPPGSYPQESSFTIMRQTTTNSNSAVSAAPLNSTVSFL